MGIIGRRADYKTFRLLLQNGGLPGPFRLVLALVQILSRERAAKLHFAETEAVAQTVGGLGESCELFAAFRLQQIELVVAVREAAQAYSEQTNLPSRVAMLAKKALEHGINVGIKLRRLRKRFGARVGFESSVTNRQCECSRGQPRFAQPLAGLLREVAERDRKSTRLNSSHTVSSYAVFCLKKKRSQKP